MNLPGTSFFELLICANYTEVTCAELTQLYDLTNPLINLVPNSIAFLPKLADHRVV